MEIVLDYELMIIIENTRDEGSCVLTTKIAMIKRKIIAAARANFFIVKEYFKFVI